MNEEKTIPLKVGPYRLLDTIGSGSYATVKLAYRGDSNQTIACRIIPKFKLSSKTDRMRFENEIRIQQQLYHPNIVRLLDLYQDTLNYYCILEMCPDGQLYQYIANNGKMDVIKAATLFKQIASALEYLHSRNIAHRDLKPENIFMIHDDFVKLGDFGFSKTVSEISALGSKTACGSPVYVAPELLKPDGYNPLKSDMWSLGVILYAMMTAKIPWTKKNHSQLFDQIMRGDYLVPIYVDEDAKDLIRKLMEIDPDKRLTAAEVLEHPFITKNAKTVHYKTEAKIVTLKRLDEFFEVDGDDSEIETLPIMRRSRSFVETDFDTVKRTIERKPIKTKIIVNRLKRKSNSPANVIASSSSIQDIPAIQALPTLQVRHRVGPSTSNLTDWRKIRRFIVKSSARF